MDENLTERQKSIIELVQRQTDYDKEQIISLLNDHKWDYIKIIKEYLDIKPSNNQKDNTQLNTNQALIKEMRGFLDTAGLNYYRSKEIKELINKNNNNKQ